MVRAVIYKHQYSWGKPVGSDECDGFPGPLSRTREADPFASGSGSGSGSG
jgi:hypothetical protein